MKGSNFEIKVRNQLRDYGFSVVRLQQGGVWGGTTSSLPCDFIVFKDDKAYLIECKVVNDKKKSLTMPRQLEDMAKIRKRNPKLPIFAVIRYECLGRKEMHKIANYDDMARHDKKSINCNLDWLESWDEFLATVGEKKKKDI